MSIQKKTLMRTGKKSKVTSRNRKPTGVTRKAVAVKFMKVFDKTTPL